MHMGKGPGRGSRNSPYEDLPPHEGPSPLDGLNEEERDTGADRVFGRLMLNLPLASAGANHETIFGRVVGNYVRARQGTSKAHAIAVEYVNVRDFVCRTQAMVAEWYPAPDALDLTRRRGNGEVGEALARRVHVRSHRIHVRLDVDRDLGDPHQPVAGEIRAVPCDVERLPVDDDLTHLAVGEPPAGRGLVHRGARGQSGHPSAANSASERPGSKPR